MQRAEPGVALAETLVKGGDFHGALEQYKNASNHLTRWTGPAASRLTITVARSPPRSREAAVSTIKFYSRSDH